MKDIKEKVKKFLYQRGTECGGKEEQKLNKKIYGNDKIYEIWESSLVKFAEKITQAQREDILKEIREMKEHFGDPENCERCKTINEVLKIIKKH